jgi:hypothetical protein
MPLAIANPLGSARRGSAGRAECTFGLRALPVVAESAATLQVGVAGVCFGTRIGGGNTRMRTAKQTESEGDHRPEHSSGITQHERRPLASRNRSLPYLAHRKRTSCARTDPNCRKARWRCSKSHR